VIALRHREQGISFSHRGAPEEEKGERGLSRSLVQKSLQPQVTIFKKDSKGWERYSRGEGKTWGQKWIATQGNSVPMKETLRIPSLPKLIECGP